MRSNPTRKKCPEPQPRVKHHRVDPAGTPDGRRFGGGDNLGKTSERLGRAQDRCGDATTDRGRGRADRGAGRSACRLQSQRGRRRRDALAPCSAAGAARQEAVGVTRHRGPRLGRWRAIPAPDPASHCRIGKPAQLEAALCNRGGRSTQRVGRSRSMFECLRMATSPRQPHGRLHHRQHFELRRSRCASRSHKARIEATTPVNPLVSGTECRSTCRRRASAEVRPHACETRGLCAAERLHMADSISVSQTDASSECRRFGRPSCGHLGGWGPRLANQFGPNQAPVSSAQVPSAHGLAACHFDANAEFWARLASVLLSSKLRQVDAGDPHALRECRNTATGQTIEVGA